MSAGRYWSLAYTASLHGLAKRGSHQLFYESMFLQHCFMILWPCILPCFQAWEHIADTAVLRILSGIWVPNYKIFMNFCLDMLKKTLCIPIVLAADRSLPLWGFNPRRGLTFWTFFTVAVKLRSQGSICCGHKKPGFTHIYFKTLSYLDKTTTILEMY